MFWRDRISRYRHVVRREDGNLPPLAFRGVIGPSAAHPRGLPASWPTRSPESGYWRSSLLPHCGCQARSMAPHRCRSRLRRTKCQEKITKLPAPPAVAYGREQPYPLGELGEPHFPANLPTARRAHPPVAKAKRSYAEPAPRERRHFPPAVCHRPGWDRGTLHAPLGSPWPASANLRPG